jgi:dTMP kinase
MTQNLFITFEGPEGGGKTTQVVLLKRHLTALGYDVLVTRQPGGDPVGIELRKIMLDIGRDKVSERAELLMMMADRSQSVDTVIRPHLAAGGAVICDRYVDSSVAYQGYGRGIDIEWIHTLNKFASDGVIPVLTILLDIDPTVGLMRQQDKNRMEMEGQAFHDRVRLGYLSLAEQFPERIKIVNAVQSIALVHEEIKALVAAKIC